DVGGGGMGRGGVGVLRTTASTISGINADLHGGDYGVEVVNSSGNDVSGNSVHHWGGDAYVVVADPQYGDPLSDANRVEDNLALDGSTGIELIEIDGGTVSNTSVGGNTTSETNDSGILVDAVTSQDGSGNPPFDPAPGEGPSESLIEANTTERNALDGIDVESPGNTLTGNFANNNGGFGIFAVTGN